MARIFFLILLIAGLLAWAPWLSQTQAQTLINSTIQSQEQTVSNTCTLTFIPTSIQKVVFGYTASVSYVCALGGTSGIAQGQNTVFVTFWSAVLNVPNPIIK